MTIRALDAGVVSVLSWKTARITLDRYLLLIYSKYFIRALYTLSYTERFYCVTSYLTEKLSKMRSFDRQ